jgi:hypothetical protein
MEARLLVGGRALIDGTVGCPQAVVADTKAGIRTPWQPVR